MVVWFTLPIIEYRTTPVNIVQLCTGLGCGNIDQLDGNVSICSSDEYNRQSCKKLPNHPKPQNGQKIDKIAAALNLPTVATYNLRSMIPKINSLKIDILERAVDLGFSSGNLGANR